MSTKIITVSATPPAESSGADYNKAAPLNATEFDQNLVNLRAAVDRRCLLTGNGGGAFAVGALTANTADGDNYGLTAKAASGQIQIAGYQNASVGGYIASVNIAGTTLLPLTLNCAGFTASTATGTTLDHNVNGVNITRVSSAGLDVTGLTTTTTLRINTAPDASAATASTHKVAVNLNGTTYYLLATNV